MPLECILHNLVYAWSNLAKMQSAQSHRGHSDDLIHFLKVKDFFQIPLQVQGGTELEEHDGRMLNSRHGFGNTDAGFPKGPCQVKLPDYGEIGPCRVLRQQSCGEDGISRFF